MSTNTKVAIKEYFPSVATRDEDQISVTIRVEAEDEDEYEYEYEYEASLKAALEMNTAEFEHGLQKFHQEFASLVGFYHPNIVTYLDYIEANGTAYIVMQNIEGESLRERLERKRKSGLPEREIRQVLAPILDGLEALHETGVIHSDIKPWHIVVQNDGVPLLIEFDWARKEFSNRGYMTEIVTPMYAPLELLSEGKLGPWTDIYAMGAVVYRCIMGIGPPTAYSRVPYDTIEGVTADGYSAALLTATDAALRLKEEDRPQTIAEWRSMLNWDVKLDDKGIRSGRGLRRWLHKILGH